MNKQRRRRSAIQWQEVVDQQKASSQSVSTYCRERNVCVKSFYTWRRRLRLRATAQPKDFMEVPLVESRERSLRITTPEGYCLDVREGTDSAFLKSVIVALGPL